MKNNKTLIYLALVAVGLLGGWLLFSSSSSVPSDHDHQAAEQANQLWTCSMHPQIMQPEAGDCPICGMDLIPAEQDADGLAADQFKLTENAMALANVQTSVVGHDEISAQGIKLSGKIIQNETSNMVQVSYISGRIERLNVSFTGEKVNKGQLLATIYSPELYAAQQELITAAGLKDTQPALYQAVKNKLKLWKLSDKQIDRIESTQKVIENFPIYATVSGTVAEKLVEQGAAITQGQPLLKIANLGSVWANFDLYENQLNAVKKGQEILIKTNAYPATEFKAKIDFIDPVLNAATRTVGVRAVLNNKENLFKPGMFVEGMIEGKSTLANSELSIPASAVLWTGERSVVYIKANKNESVFELREITLGNKQGDQYQVLSGLKTGDEIVTNGTFTVDAAAQLRGKKSMMNASGSKTDEGMDMIDYSLYSGSADFQHQLGALLSNYMGLKNALVEDNALNSKEQMKIFSSALKKMDSGELKDQTSKQHWAGIAAQLATSATNLQNENDLKEQRSYFEELSIQMTDAVKSFGVDQKVYNMYCPMVKKDKGGYWLSMESTVENPYHGSSMLNCGNVAEVIEVAIN